MNSAPRLESEKLLYKLILQFAIYSQGTNSKLDPHLVNISKSLKKGANYLQLNSELIALSKTLAHISRAESTVEITDDEQKSRQQYFINRLNILLAESDIPFKFHNQCAALRQKSKKDLDEQTYKKVIDSAISLLVNIKKHVANEQRDIEAFLAEIPKQLTFLEDHTLYVTNSNDESIENRGNFNSLIESQVNNIRHSAEEASELSILQTSINQHLKELSSQLSNHKTTEDKRQHETQKQLNLMSQKLQDMEVEADSLRNNLKIAHDKALRDALTGLPNRLAYDERVKLESTRWNRYKEPLSLIIWDIDLFKLINDNFGHKAGDKTLTLVAQLILNNCRETDFIARFGGEEFVMLLTNTTSEQALELANNIRLLISKSGFNHNGESIKLTISCGISQFSEGDDHGNVFERADQALYSSKEQGRNKCSILD